MEDLYVLVYPHEPFRQLFGSGLLYIIKNSLFNEHSRYSQALFAVQPC